MIKTILVPTDGSDHANKATTLAADIAEKYGARLVLLHVMSRGPLPEAWRHMAEVEHVVEPAAPSMAGIPTANIPTTKNPSEAGAGNRNREVLEFVGRLFLVFFDRLDVGSQQVSLFFAEHLPGRVIGGRA